MIDPSKHDSDAHSRIQRITQSISGITPEKLENSLSEVTDGLALAFDATALALGLTMLTMFLSFMVERAEQAILDTVDRYTDRAVGVLDKNADGKMAMTRVTLRPSVVFGGAPPSAEQLRDLHEKAHERCFIAESAVHKGAS